MDIILPPMLALQRVNGSFPFASKYIPIPPGVKTLLGSQVQENLPLSNRNATTTNGWFAPLRPVNGHDTPISPIGLSGNHAEIWGSNGQIFVQDLGSAFGTYVNGVRMTGEVALKNNDILQLGQQIGRNAQTPTHITDQHLMPIIAKVTCLGVPSRSNHRV